MSYLSGKGGLRRERDISGDVVAEESGYVRCRECYGVAEEIDARGAKCSVKKCSLDIPTTACTTGEVRAGIGTISKS